MTKQPRYVWSSIKDILDERRRNGRLEYLVEWENDPDTGESFPTEWVGIPLIEVLHSNRLLTCCRNIPRTSRWTPSPRGREGINPKAKTWRTVASRYEDTVGAASGFHMHLF
jgi:hypothetical protein